MKHLIFLITILSFIGCDPNSNTINPNTNPNGTNHDWWFEIKVDGVPHRIEGSFNSCDASHNWSFYSGSNLGYVSNLIYTQIIANLDNKGVPDYGSGESFYTLLGEVQNLTIGYNDFILKEDKNINESFIGVECYEKNGCTNGLSSVGTGFFLTPLDTTDSYHSEMKFPINITQYPSARTPNNNGCTDAGNPIIGSGSHTIYVLDTIDNSLPSNLSYRYRRPYNIDIDFKIYMNY